ncbi:MAG: tRNA-I(6)A37 thiotransferase enzyme MiaB, bifunctional enzyme involved in thiolation and methylation of tRNA [Berkelbacteria bacterium GW2011_GWE1_39_12]|uniref:tRNA-I(6)A37 thiotransferase enzyme MiaB, bifunctional enzyme involved in thiolation and methylation of tRNA n=1 Tax=Berkelbacteria bacterium GW2011_GWE1_39_12 TaxID=1618337 RepID=A0A0G4B568_9BACT|nr:MAG: tRNA-I(6)A37 thiotransferase enzyme MiaB, bifunctional enzyme involved in thiolation and methylation of tRNA [Berkelbacteria bacterium GW2011_GWE1_39_12]
MNVSDSQRIESKLSDLDYKPASEKEAGLVIINACSVRQHAVDRIWGHFKKWADQDKKQILVTGCVIKKDRSVFRGKNVAFFDIKDLNNLDKVLAGFTHKEDEKFEYFSIMPKLSGKIAYIPIMTGCNNFCSYCAVPYTRGREVSRPIEEILTEARAVLESGYKEILLLGQNVNSYEYDFAKLLIAIDMIPGDFKFNFMSSNPHDMTDNIVKTFGKLKKWPNELHIAMQSGDDEILKKMNRKYNSEEFFSLIKKIKEQVPDVKLSTDIIVGFPGETKELFLNTLNICKKISFYKAYIFKYSPRLGTVSAKMSDDVSDEEKKRRFEELDQLINKR